MGYSKNMCVHSYNDDISWVFLFWGFLGGVFWSMEVYYAFPQKRKIHLRNEKEPTMSQTQF